MAAVSFLLPSTSNTPASLYEATERRDYLLHTLQSHLTTDEYCVVVLLFGLDDGDERSYAEAGALLTLTVPEVRDTRNAALAKLSAIPELRRVLREAISRKRTIGVIHQIHGD